MLRNPKQSFIPELHLKDTESAIKNKLIDSLTELKVFKVVTTLVLEFKKIQRDNVTLYIVPFIWTQKQKQLLIKVTLMMYFKV